MNSNKLGQKRKDRLKESRKKVLKKRVSIREKNKLEKELQKIRDSVESRTSPIRNNYE